jgi:hypothetical protein
MQTQIAALMEALNDPDPEVRGAAAESLGRIGYGEEVVQALAAMLTKQFEPARRSAAEALASLRDNRAVVAILECLSHPSVPVRFAIITALTDSLNSIRKPALFYIIVTSDSGPGWFRVRPSSDGIMIGQSVNDIVDALIRHTSDSNRRVREAAINALDVIRRHLRALRLHDKEGLPEEQSSMDGGGDDDGWGGPSTGGVKLPPSAAEKAVLSAVKVAALKAPEPRFAELSFYAWDRPVSMQTLLPANSALRVEEQYALEVAIRVKPGGIPFAGKKQRSIYVPQQKSDVTIWVTVAGDGFEIENPTQTLVLPPTGDSTKNALFLVTPTRQGTVGKQNSPALLVRLYYHFNLLEEIKVRAHVVGKFENAVQKKKAVSVSFVQNRLERKYVDLDNIEPRAMHIAVNASGALYQLTFTFYNSEKETVEFTAPVSLSAEELEDSLLTVRRLFFEIAMSETFSKQLEGDEDEFITNLRSLARAGSNLWTLLFKREISSPLYKIGQWLEEHPLERDSIIQVSLGADAPDFIFPWSIIYDRPLPKEDFQLPDPDGFWGIRYCIEQKLPRTKGRGGDVTHIEDNLKVEVILWERFRNLSLQIEMMKSLSERSQGRLSFSVPPHNNAETVFNLLRECDAHILYFYTHGYTRRRMAATKADTDLGQFIQIYESLKKDSPLRQTYQLLYESIKQEKFEPSRSWIELTYGKLYLEQLYQSVGQFLTQPFVILNMCESAQVIPSLSDSFIHFFLDRGAIGVVGTECPMTIEFAHPFSETFLTEILAGAQAGRALLHARRRYMGLKNPLGLAYTLFGSATASFQPPLLELRASGFENQPQP